MPQAQPGDYNTAPSNDGTYSNANLTAPHHVASDGNPNGGFEATDKTRQFSFAEAAIRGAQTSAQP